MLSQKMTLSISPASLTHSPWFPICLSPPLSLIPPRFLDGKGGREGTGREGKESRGGEGEHRRGQQMGGNVGGHNTGNSLVSDPLSIYCQYRCTSGQGQDTVFTCRQPSIARKKYAQKRL